MFKQILGGLFCLSLVAPTLAAPKSAQLLKVSDGDTITVLMSGRKNKIRLYGIDAPEKDQAGGKGATRFLKSILTKKLFVDIIKKDRYKRLIAFVKNSDGENINYQMVAAGWAWWYKKYYKSQKMAQLQAQAQRKKIGLWSQQNPRPPWLYRAWRRNLPELPDSFKSSIVYTEPGRFYLHFKGAVLIATTGVIPRKNCNWPRIARILLFERVRVKDAVYRRARFIRGTVLYQDMPLGRFLQLEGLCD